jgi:hypothetical protein
MQTYVYVCMFALRMTSAQKRRMTERERDNFVQRVKDTSHSKNKTHLIIVVLQF